MISIKKNVKDISVYAWETTWFVLKPFIIFGFILIPFTVYCFVTGNIPEHNIATLRNAYMSLFVLILLFLYVVRVYFYYKKNLKLYFRDADSDGNVEVTISCEGDEYLFENLSAKSVNRLRKTDIKKTKVTKNCLFIRTKTNLVIFFPKTDEILNLFVEKEEADPK